MKTAFFPTLLALLTPTISAQTLLASTLPTCAQQCTVLQNAQSSCLPSGGAPVSNQGTYQSCFCQSALLTSLMSAQPVQLCTQCSASDMAAIQNWYKGLCSAGANAAVANPATTTSSSSTTSATLHTTTSTHAPAASATIANNAEGVNPDAPKGPWMSTHWKWVVMLIVLVLGLTALAVGGTIFHRRYHRRRESQWSQATGSAPNINTWGPGQSVHDLGFTTGPGGSAFVEKGKGKEQVRALNEPPPARMRENRLSKF